MAIDNFLSIKTHGEVVFKNHSGNYKAAHRIEKADHGEVHLMAGFENYLKILGNFIRKKLVGSNRKPILLSMNLASPMLV